MARKIVAIVISSVLLAACGIQQSGLDANTTVTIAGKVVADGKPLAATKVVLLKELDLGEVVGGLFVTTASLGLACLSDHPPALCSNNAHLATTDLTGAFSFSVKGGQTQGSLGTASTMEVMAHVPARASEVAGAASMAEFQVQTATLALPDLRIWQPDLSWSAGDRPAWSPVPGTGSATYSVEFYDLHGGQWWVTGAMKSGDRVDGHVLENLDGTFDVAARTRGTANGTTVDNTYISGSVPFRGDAGAPPSRGAGCAPVTSNARLAFARCPLTSGSVASNSQLAVGATGVVIDLGQQRTISLVVLRGCSGQCKLAVSSDLNTWTDVGSVTGTYTTLSVAPNAPRRFVRVSTSDVASLRQVSVW